MQHPNEEKETTCVFDYMTDEWNVYSCVPRHINRLMKIASPYWTEKDGERITAAKWKLKASQVNFSVIRQSNMSYEQREAAKERLADARLKRLSESTI
ncbi:hypothetical protein PA598K_06894 [Paenibacillus sp. 598K]|uniref:hypothetical protein n=1 Tax=Paenibacillus sp. 598K TaxID=1117987 RepID=UPI000FFA23EC|nr:hypothetical protein [Paenibacillus sp. 598K]GBF78276.1 hypothetical protein PA598K_06894 [Paenibacillus sp. 598K]